MAKTEKREHATEKETKLAPRRAALTLPMPAWMERFEEMLENRWAPLFPALRWPDELLALRVPPLDVYEENGSLVVKAELPGMRREEIEVGITGALLTISGKREKEEKLERKDYHRMERSSGAFTRTVRLPFEVKLEAVTARFENGVLEIRAPKADEAKATSRKITIG